MPVKKTTKPKPPKPNDKKGMTQSEKMGVNYALKSERRSLLAPLRRKAIRDAAKRTDISAVRFTQGAAKGKAMLEKDKAMARRGGSMPKTKAKKITRGKKK